MGRPAPTATASTRCSSSIVNFSNNPVEIIESEQPLLIERYGYVPDTGGAGEFRGGLAVVRDYRFEVAPGADAQFLMRTDRRRFVPYGLAGGRPGRPSSNVLDPDGPRAADAADEGAASRSIAATCSATRSRAPAAGAIRCHAIPARVLHDVRDQAAGGPCRSCAGPSVTRGRGGSARRGGG